MILDIEKYPLFVPWCLDGKIRERKETEDFIEIKADLKVGKRFINEIYSSLVLYSKKKDLVTVTNIEGPLKFLKNEWKFKKTGRSIIVLGEGRLVNLSNATGHPSFVMSNSFTNQTLAQLELQERAESYGKTVTTLPKYLDEKVARLHLDKFGAKLTVLSDKQCDYLGLPKNGPYKNDQYRY